MAQLGTTQIAQEELLSDEQLIKSIQLAQQRASSADNDAERQKYINYAKKSYDYLKANNGPGYVQFEAARQLGEKLENVNAKRGIPTTQRLAYTFLPDPEQKQIYLQRKYGRDNVQTVAAQGVERFFVKQGNEWTPVDEVQLTAQDFTTDIAREVPAAMAEIGISLGLGGATWLPRVVRVAAPEVAGFLVQTAADIGVPMSQGIDSKASQAIAQNALWSGGALAFETAARPVARMVSGKPKDELVENFRAAENILEKNNVVPSLREGVKSGGGWLRQPYLRATNNIGTTLREIEQGITGGGTRDFGASLEQYATVQLQANRRLADEVAARETSNQIQTRRAIQDIAQKRLNALQAPPAEAPHIRGENFRKLQERRYGQYKQAASQRYDNVMARSDAAPGYLDAAELDEKRAQIILDSNLPIDQQANLIKKYAPSKIKKWNTSIENAFRGKRKLTKEEKQAQEFLRVLGEEAEVDPPVDLNFRDLNALRASIRNDISFDVTDDGYSQGLATPTLRRLEGMLTNEMETLAKRGGYLDDFKQANKFYQDKVVPYKQGTMKRIRAGRDKAGYITDDNVMQDFLFGKNAADNVRQLGNTVGWASPEMRMVREELATRITEPSRLPSGMVDLKQLKQSLGTINPDVWEAAYGKGSVKKLNKLLSVVNLSDFDARSSDPELLRAYFNARTDQEANQVLSKLRKFATDQVDNRRYQDKVVQYVMKRGDPSLVDPDTVSRTLLQMDGAELKRFFETMPNENMANSFRNAMLVELVSQSRSMESSVVRRAFANGYDPLVDPFLLMEKLSDKKIASRLNAVFPEGDKQIENLKAFASAYASVMEYAARKPAKFNSGVTPYLRMGPGGDVVPRAVVSGGHIAGEAWKKAWEPSAPMTPSYKTLWAMVVGSDQAIQAALLEANRDPVFKEWMIQNLTQLWNGESPSQQEAPPNASGEAPAR